MQAVLDLPTVSSVADTVGTWCVVRTHALRERKVAELIREQGFACYLPVERVRRVYRGRAPETIGRPLYPSYLFAAYGDEFERHDIRRTRYVSEIILDPQPERLAADIRSLEIVLSLDPFRDAADLFQKGRRVRVVSGPYIDAEGEIIRRDRKVKGETITKDILCIGVITLGRVVEVEIDPACCEPM